MTKAKRMAAAIISMSLLFVFAYFLFVPTAVPVELAGVVQGVCKETVRSDGVLRSREKFTVPAFADGDIKRVSLRVGDPVKKGQTITEIYWDVRYVPLRSPIDGVISKVYRESAGPIRRGEPIVELIDPARLEVMVELLTSDAVRISPGARAWIANWSGGPPIEARIRRISKAGFTKPSALGVEEERTEVTAELDHPPEDFLQRAGSGFHVDVTILVAEIPDALKVPVGALFRERNGWALYVVEGRRARKRAVDVTAFCDDEAAVRSGVSAGDRLIVYPGELVRDGARVKTVE